MPFRFPWSLGLLSAALGGALAAACAYAGLFAALVPDPPVPSAKEALLLHLPGPRLIIDSGSSAVQGLDATRLGLAANRLGFLASDSGDFSPVGKAWRLLATARRGDLVLLPLEWLHYDRPARLDLPYMRAATGVLPLYFRAAPWRERLRLLASLPPAEALRIMWANLSAARPSPEAAERDILGLHAMFRSGWDGGGAEPPKRLLPEARATDCAGYLFRPGQVARGPDPAVLEPLFAPLRRLRAKGVTVAFLPPVTTGADCYAGADVEGYWRRLSATMRRAGFLALGDPAALWFGPGYTTNTYYHVTYAGRALATDRVAAWLRAAGLAAPPHPPHVLEEAAFGLERSLHARDWPAIPLAPGRTVSGGDPALTPVAGWWGGEAGGRWMRDPEAVFRLRASGARSLTLSLRALAGPMPLQVSVNGVARTEATITPGGETVDAPLPPGAKRIEVTLRARDALRFPSPRELGMGADERSLGLELVSARAR